MSIAVVGRPGSGKTLFARYLSDCLGGRAVFDDCKEDSISGFMEPIIVAQRLEDLRYTPTVFYRCFKNPAKPSRILFVRKYVYRRGGYVNRGVRFFMYDGREYRQVGFPECILIDMADWWRGLYRTICR